MLLSTPHLQNTATIYWNIPKVSKRHGILSNSDSIIRDADKKNERGFRWASLWHRMSDVFVFSVSLYTVRSISDSECRRGDSCDVSRRWCTTGVTRCCCCCCCCWCVNYEQLTSHRRICSSTDGFHCTVACTQPCRNHLPATAANRVESAPNWLIMQYEYWLWFRWFWIIQWID